MCTDIAMCTDIKHGSVKCRIDAAASVLSLMRDFNDSQLAEREVHRSAAA